MAKNATKTDKELERRVADAYREMGAWKVQHDVELAGNQIDVYVELETSGRLLHRIAVEVKDWSKPVGVDVVNGFAAIVNLLRGKGLVDEGVIVSASGFSRPARNAAETYGIRLLAPADLEAMVEEAREAGRTQPTAPPAHAHSTGHKPERKLGMSLRSIVRFLVLLTYVFVLFAVAVGLGGQSLSSNRSWVIIVGMMGLLLFLGVDRLTALRVTPASVEATPAQTRVQDDSTRPGREWAALPRSVVVLLVCLAFAFVLFEATVGLGEQDLSPNQVWVIIGVLCGLVMLLAVDRLTESRVQEHSAELEWEWAVFLRSVVVFLAFVFVLFAVAVGLGGQSLSSNRSWVIIVGMMGLLLFLGMDRLTALRVTPGGLEATPAQTLFQDDSTRPGRKRAALPRSVVVLLVCLAFAFVLFEATVGLGGQSLSGNRVCIIIAGMVGLLLFLGMDRLTALQVTPVGLEARLAQALEEVGELEGQEVTDAVWAQKRGEEEPMDTLTWLHISDLHFRASQAYDSNIVLRALLRDVAERVQSDGLRPDLIILSGDIAFASQPEEYAMARQFLDDLLKTTGLPKDRLFLVPGNHDVDRSAISTLAAGATAILSNRDAVNRFLVSDADRALVFQRFHNYQEFINEYLSKERLPFDNVHYFYVKHIEVVGRRVAILGLNSAWLAASDEDRNRLLLGERQVRAALDAAEDADLRLAVMHHPFDWLQDFDRDDVEPLLCGGCDFVLHGHMHQVGLLQARAPDTESMIIAAGACYETREYPNSYNFVQLDLSAGKGTVCLRMYSDRRGGFWTKDVVNYRNINDGLYTFSLPARLRQSLRGTDTGTAAWDILEKYKGQRIKADSPERLDQFFVHQERLHYIDLGATSICESRGLPVRNLMPNEEFILDIPSLRGSDYNELAMKAVFEEIDQARAVGGSATDTRELLAPVQRDEDQQHLRDLIAIKRRRLWELEKQAALYGIDVPPHITLEIEDLRRQIAELKAQLER